MVNIDQLKFDERGLIPAIVVDAASRRVLTLAYMSRESLQISMEKELTCFFSRSRQELWLKGETSGNWQHIVSITADCDMDALEVVVEPDGPACHLGTFSCFENPVWQSETRNDFTLEGLYQLLEGRKTSPKEGSYTTYLFQKGIDKILKKGRPRKRINVKVTSETHIKLRVLSAIQDRSLDKIVGSIIEYEIGEINDIDTNELMDEILESIK